MLLVARTTPLEKVSAKTDGLAVFLVDLRSAIGNGLTIWPVRTMMNHSTTEMFFDDLEVPVENRVDQEGKGFRYLLDGLNAERVLIAAECVGDGRWFVERSCAYANDRVVFKRPIGQNQEVQFSIARAHVNVEAADLMRVRAAERFDAVEPCGAEANMAKLLAADASWEAANVAVQTFGGLVSLRTMTSNANSERLVSIRLRLCQQTSSSRISASMFSASPDPSDAAPAGNDGCCTRAGRGCAVHDASVG